MQAEGEERHARVELGVRGGRGEQRRAEGEERHAGKESGMG